ncbi:MAG: hypothetical protein WC939_02960, partial [Acholeplasmataceae bacterium]
NGTAWTKPLQTSLLANSSSVQLTVSAAMAEAIATTLDEDDEFLIEFASMQGNINQHDIDIAALEQKDSDILDGTQAFTEISLDDGLGNIETITHASKVALDNEVARLETDKADKTYVDSQDLLDEKLTNKVTNFSVVDDDKYPSVEAVKEYVDTQDTFNEKLVNKATDFNVINDTKYPTTEAVKEYVDTRQTSVYDFKGSVLFVNLPTTGQKVGDTYNITNDFTLGGEDYLAGTNVAWNGTGWDALGSHIPIASEIDFDNTDSGRTATEVQEALDEAFDEIDVIDGRVTANEENIVNLEAKDIEHEKDLIDHEQRIDSIEAITRKQDSDIASVDDDGIGILHMGKDVAETTVTTKIEGLLLDSPNLVSSEAVANLGTRTFTTVNSVDYYVFDGTTSSIITGDGNDYTLTNNTGASAIMHAYNKDTLVANKQYSPLFSTTFDLMSDAQIKAQMDLWVANKTLPNSIMSVDMDKRVTSVGKNLFDGELEVGTIGFSTGNNETNITRSRTKNFIKVLPSTAYTLKSPLVTNDMNIYEYDINKVFISATNFSSAYTGKTQTMSSNTHYIRFQNASTNDTTVLYQLEQGTVATTYEPYRSSSMYLDSGEVGYSYQGTRDTIEFRNGEALFIDRINDTQDGLRTTPIETPITVVNNAMAYPNGTFLIEDVVRRIGVYSSGITVDKEIKTLDNIYKLNDDGSSTKLLPSGATVAGDGLSFTHSSLSNGDFVWFDYYYQGTNVKGLSTVYYYGDNMIVSGSGTTSGKVYKIVPTVVDENIVWTKVEV